MSAMAYRLLVPVRLSGNTSQQRRTTLKSLSSTSIPMLNQTRPAKNSRTSRFQAGVALRTHPLRQNENCCCAAPGPHGHDRSRRVWGLTGRAHAGEHSGGRELALADAAQNV